MHVRDPLAEAYPPVCECCGAHHRSSDAAVAEGWTCSWDGWLCAACDESAELSPRVGEALRDALHDVYRRAADEAAGRH